MSNNLVKVTMYVPKEVAYYLPNMFSRVKIEPVVPGREADITQEEVIEFCRTRNSPVDGVRFYRYYSRRGWLDASGEKIENWQEKLIEWENNGLDSKPANKPEINRSYELYDKWASNEQSGVC